MSLFQIKHILLIVCINWSVMLQLRKLKELHIEECVEFVRHKSANKLKKEKKNGGSKKKNAH